MIPYSSEGSRKFVPGKLDNSLHRRCSGVKLTWDGTRFYYSEFPTTYGSMWTVIFWWKQSKVAHLSVKKNRWSKSQKIRCDDITANFHDHKTFLTWNFGRILKDCGFAKKFCQLLDNPWRLFWYITKYFWRFFEITLTFFSFLLVCPGLPEFVYIFGQCYQLGFLYCKIGQMLRSILALL